MEIRTNINPLIYPAFGLAAIILIGLFTLHKPEFEYTMSLDETHQYVMVPGDEIYPFDAMQILQEDKPGFQFIDLRNEYEFNLGHLPNAINIPQYSLLKEDFTDMLEGLEEDSVMIVLYGRDQSQANGPWMLLKQLGYKNVRLLMGGYNYYAALQDSNFVENEIPRYYTEQNWYDYQSIIDKVVADAQEALTKNEASTELQAAPKPKPQPEPVIPVKKAKQAVIEGGC